MTHLNRATERSHLGNYRAELMFSRHLQRHPRASASWFGAIHEGTEPLIEGAELRRQQIRNSLLGSRKVPTSAAIVR